MSQKKYINYYVSIKHRSHTCISNIITFFEAMFLTVYFIIIYICLESRMDSDQWFKGL